MIDDEKVVYVDIRFKCLEVAARCYANYSPEQLAKASQQLYDFVIDKK